MQDTALHGFQTIVDVRHSALEDDIAGVIQEPTFIEVLYLENVAEISLLSGQCVVMYFV
jgi:hypothetical protein